MSLLDGGSGLLLGWSDSSLSNGGVLEELLEFGVFLDSEEDVSWDESVLLLSLADGDTDFEDLGNQVLEDGSKVDWSSDSDSLAVSTSLEHSGDSSDWEGQSSLG